MRLSVAAVALSIGLWPLAGAQSLVASSSDTSTPAAPAPTPADTGASADAAAARHTKRTECLKQAKTKKLVGAEKTAFIKDCVATTR